MRAGTCPLLPCPRLRAPNARARLPSPVGERDPTRRLKAPRAAGRTRDSQREDEAFSEGGRNRMRPSAEPRPARRPQQRLHGWNAHGLSVLNPERKRAERPDADGLPVQTVQELGHRGGRSHSGPGNSVPEEEERGSGELTSPNPFACSDPGPAQAGTDTAPAALRGEAGLPRKEPTGHVAATAGLSRPLTAPEPRARTPRLSTRAPPPRAPASGTGPDEEGRGGAGTGAWPPRGDSGSAMRAVAWARVLCSSSSFNFLAALCNAWHFSSPTRE